LNGAFTFQVFGPHENSWGASLICGGQPTFMGGSDTRDNGGSGTATFNGAGSVSGSITFYGQFNQAASDATVSCASNGNAVYFAPSTSTITGTYSILPDGTGAMTVTASPPAPGGGNNSNGFILRLAGACAGGLDNTVFLIILKPNNSVEASGIARFQSTC